MSMSAKFPKSWCPKKTCENGVMLEYLMHFVLIVVKSGNDLVVCIQVCCCQGFGDMSVVSLRCDSLIWCFSQLCRWFCDCVPRAHKSRGALCPEEDVCQQWARSAGVQMRDSNNGELLRLNLVLTLGSCDFLAGVKTTGEGSYKTNVFWNSGCSCKSPRNLQMQVLFLVKSN